MFFAHRGYLIKKPENTVASFLEAIKIGAQAIEVDVVKTKDNKIICSHNHYLYKGKKLLGEVSKMEYSYIKKAITAYKLKNDKKPMPELIKVINQIPNETKINIEVKTRGLTDILIVKELVKIINDNNIANKVLVSSFNPLALWYIKRLDKNIRTGFLYENPKYLFLKRAMGLAGYQPRLVRGLNL